MSLVFSNTDEKKFIPLDLVFYSHRYNLPHFLSSLPSELTTVPEDVISSSIISFLIGNSTNYSITYDVYNLQYEKRSNILYCKPSETGSIRFTTLSDNDIEYLSGSTTDPDKFYLKLHNQIKIVTQTGNYKNFIENISRLLLTSNFQSQSTYDMWISVILLSHIEKQLELNKEFIS